jgi:phage I-like protein
MSRREPMHDLENGLAGPVELDAASGAEGAAAPDWVTLLPAGPDIAGRSGRRFQLPREAAEAVVAAFRTNGADLPVDLEHSTEIKGPKGEAAPAVGWIKELRVTGAGAVEGRVDWTGAGRGLLAERAYRYLSPSVLFDRASRTIRRLVSAGLTNKPDFRMPALAREDGADGPGDAPDAAGPLAAVATALGLDAGAGIEAVLDAIATARSPDPARFVPASAVREMIAERGRMVARMREDEARARVDAAISGGCLPPAMRDWAVAHCRQDPASFDAFLDAVSPAFACLFEASPAARAPQTDDGAAAERIARQLGLAPDALRA